MGPAWVCGGGQSPTAPSPRRPRDPHPAGSSWPPAHPGPPADAHPRQDTVSTSRPTLGHTQRHTKTHTGLWPVTLTLGCVRSASQMHVLTPSGRTHIPSLAHTHSRSHTLSKGEATRDTQAGTACPGCSQPPRGPTQARRSARRSSYCSPGGPTLHGAVCRLPAVLLQKAQAPGSWGHLLKAQHAQGSWTGEGLPQGPPRIPDRSARQWAALVTATFSGRLCFPASRATSKGVVGLLCVCFFL